MARIAFIGLGNMGLPMARNLLKAGHTLSGFDLVQATVAQLASEARGQLPRPAMPPAVWMR